MTKLEKIIKDHQTLVECRRTWENDWHAIRELVRPNSQDPQRTTIGGESKTHSIYDGTAVLALEEMASGLHTFLTNPVERWFSLETTDAKLNVDPDYQAWLEEVSDIIYDIYSNEATSLNQSLHEVYLDLGGFGTAILGQEEKGDQIYFCSHPTASCWLSEDHRGRVNRVDREVEKTLLQISMEFGTEGFTPDMLKALTTRPHDKDKIVHVVMPREERDLKRIDALNKPWASFWYSPQFKTLLKESGYDELPYHVTRWVKLSEETYGRSPAMNCLPDIKLLNVMERTMIKAAQKIADPVIFLDNDSVLLGLVNSPGGVNYREPGSADPYVLETGRNLPISLEMTNQKRDFIRQCFFSDWLRMEKQKIEMTATEVMDRREEKLRLIAPLLGRQQNELLGPMVTRTYNILKRRGKIPPPPTEEGAPLKIVYVSPAAKAQNGIKAINLLRFIQETVPLIQVRPEITDAVDFDAVVQELAIARSVTRKVLRHPREISKIREDRARAEQAQQAAEIAKPASEAMLNISKARESGADVEGMLSMIS